MPQHKKLSQLPLRLNPRMPKNDQEWQQFLAELQKHFNTVASIDLCSGLTKFSDAQNAGYFLGFTRNDDGYADGTPVFVVGDRTGEKYFSFDGDDVVIGRETQLQGTDAYNNRTLYYRTFFDTIDNCVVSGTAALAPSTGSLDVSAASSVYRTIPGSIGDFSFESGIIRLKVSFNYTGLEAGDSYIMTGTRLASSSGFGFKLVSSGGNTTIRAYSRRIGTDVIGTEVSDFTGSQVFEAVLNPSDQTIEYYHQNSFGVMVKFDEITGASNLPADTAGKGGTSQRAVFYIENGIAGGGSYLVHCSELRLLHQKTS